MKAILKMLLIFVAVLTSRFSYADANLQIIYNLPNSMQSDYMQGLLKLALNYSGKKYTYANTEKTYSRQRLMESLKSGEVTLMWGGTSEQMEQDFIPIRIDAYRGLMSHRILLIRNGDQDRFDRIKNIDELKKMSFGQVKTWLDSNILENAGFKVIKITKKQGLFYMLDGSRFDALPRGVNEAWNEVASFPKLNLTVEKKFVLVYPLPTYFFVAKNRPEVAKDIEQGLETALRDGSFDHYFYESKEVKDVLTLADLPNRTAIYMTNPFLPKATPLDRKELSISIEQLRQKSKELQTKSQ